MKNKKKVKQKRIKRKSSKSISREEKKIKKMLGALKVKKEKKVSRKVTRPTRDHVRHKVGRDSNVMRSPTPKKGKEKIVNKKKAGKIKVRLKKIGKKKDFDEGKKVNEMIGKLKSGKGKEKKSLKVVKSGIFDEGKKIKEMIFELKSGGKKGVQELRPSKENVLEKYFIEVDGAKVTVEIAKDKTSIIYNLYIPKISPATKMLLDNIRNDLVTLTTVSMKELVDPDAFASIKLRFMRDAKKILNERLPRLDSNIEQFLIGMLMQEMLGLGKIEFLVADPRLEEIVVPSSKEPIKVFSKKYGWLNTNIIIKREEDIINYSNIIARRVGRQITVLSPLLDAHLVTGDRVNAVLYPVNTKGNTITIRKFSRDPFTVIDLINNKTCDVDIVSLLWLATEFEMNILISGGTGSGKTSFLNACMPFIPPNQRIISIEDTRELMLPEFLYWTPLVTRTPNPEGKGEVSMLHLLVNSLRMRPDRIILGEMRRQEEAMVLFEAMHTGHSVYATVHADTAAETISRLVNPPLNVPSNLLKSVNLNVVMFRDRKKGIRRVWQIAEFEAAADGAAANILYRWVPDTDKVVKHKASSRFFEDISRATGMSETVINKDLAEKKKILLWLIKENIRSLEEFGKVMNLYYKNKELLMKYIGKGDKKSILMGIK